MHVAGKNFTEWSQQLALSSKGNTGGRDGEENVEVPSVARTLYRESSDGCLTFSLWKTFHHNVIGKEGRHTNTLSRLRSVCSFVTVLCTPNSKQTDKVRVKII